MIGERDASHAILVVGECRAPSGAHLPDGASGRRLADVAGPERWQTLLRIARFENLCERRFYPADATIEALILLKDNPPPAEDVLLLGRRVADAFHVDVFGTDSWTPRRRVKRRRSTLARTPYLTTVWRHETPLKTRNYPRMPFALHVFPHPSGRCRWWNDPSNWDRARVFLRELIDRAATKVKKQP